MLNNRGVNSLGEKTWKRSTIWRRNNAQGLVECGVIRAKEERELVLSMASVAPVSEHGKGNSLGDGNASSSWSAY